ncbi:hypothetical protein CLOM_g10332 [Closterium sp. NIES-68]|nr:hypothetical protein CLOM_g10332 [Closterium sp. NIES-68]
MARQLILAAALLLLAVSLTATPVSAHSANGLADDVGNVTVTNGVTSWSVTILNITGGWKMLSEMKGSAFVPTNDAWTAARAGYLKQKTIDASVKEALNTVVDKNANETDLLAMSQGAWNVLHNLAHFHLVIQEVNTSFMEAELTPNTYYSLTTHKSVPIFLLNNSATGKISVTAKKPAGVNPVTVPTSNDTHTSHAEVPAVAVVPPVTTPITTPPPASAIPPPVVAAASVPGTDAAVGVVVLPDIVAEHGYAIHAIDAVLFPTKASILSVESAKPSPPPLPPPPLPPRLGPLPLLSTRWQLWQWLSAPSCSCCSNPDPWFPALPGGA